MALLTKIFGEPGAKLLREAEKIVPRVNALEPEMQALSSDALREKTAEFRARLEAGGTLEDLLPQAFAAVREAAVRTTNLRHFDVQLVGGAVLHSRAIAEMKTGEGKTLVATLAAYLNALPGNGVHVITVNDYLARRDAAWMGQVYAALGLSVGVINADASYLYDSSHVQKEEDAMRDEEGSFRVFYDFLRPCTRREAYEADITYGTNSEFGFDYLRDNTAYAPGDIRNPRAYHYAIVDEIDSILIDEARTPLIISAPSADSDEIYRTFARLAEHLQPERDYEVDEKHRTVRLTDDGVSRAEKALGIENLYTEGSMKQVHHLETAVRAKALYRRDKEYVVRDGKVVIVDEFTGRLQPGRRWSEGLHQAIEAKEGVAVEKESRTLASITYQNFFRMYEKLSGMTGTAATSGEEFFKVYGLEVVVIPTNKPVVRRDRNDLIFQTEEGKMTALARRVKELHDKGQPVLIGTASIEKNELLAAYLKREGIPHEILNAKNHEREGEIIASAGEKGRVTVATNMAGRGVDIKLGGALASGDDHQKIVSLGGLAVIGTERHEARRIDNQLRGRSGRQGDPGETQFFVSLEDSLMRVFARDMLSGLMGRFGIPEDEPIEHGLVSKALETAQTKIEGFNFDARKHILEYDDVMDKQRAAVYAIRRRVLVGSQDDVAEALQEIVAHAPVPVPPEVFNPEDEGEERLVEQVTESPAQILEKKEAELGREKFLAVARHLILQALDFLWMQHLESMEYLRGSVNLRAYGQRDPLVEYRREGLRLYRELEMELAARVLDVIEKITPENMPAPAPQPAPAVTLNIPNPALVAAQGNRPGATASNNEPGRNDPCPCGSGKKWKNCGLKNAPEHQALMAAKK
ncbi:MAG: preprotein translocase subunit SecA [Minisyncoccia bacterium]